MAYNKLCIIMADGKAKRMSGLNKKKQLIEVDGEKIIDRTIRQLRALGVEPVIATHFSDFDYLDIARIIPENNDHEIKKFNANKKYYNKYKETLFIWGDAYFDDIDIREIVKTQVKKFAFFGTRYEVFAFKIKQPYYHLIDEGADYIVSKPDLDYCNTGTWGLMRFIGGHPLLPNPDHVPGDGLTAIHEPDKYIAEGLLHLVPGKTMDNDSIYDINTFCERFPDAKMEELIFTDENGNTLHLIDGKWVKK